MIGEPELDGEWGPARPPEAPAAGPGAAGPGPATGLAGRPWRWALAAVLATSVLWAVGLGVWSGYGYGQRPGEQRIDYRIPESLCEAAPTDTVAQLIGGLPKESGASAGEKTPALDWARCERGNSRPSGTDFYLLRTMVELHKKTDQQPEFGLGNTVERMYLDIRPALQSVPDLGDEALITGPDVGEEGPFELRVRDGGAVFVLDVMPMQGGLDEDTAQEGPAQRPRSPQRPDADSLRAAMIEDMRQLMHTLRR